MRSIPAVLSGLATLSSSMTLLTSLHTKWVSEYRVHLAKALIAAFFMTGAFAPVVDLEPRDAVCLVVMAWEPSEEGLT